MVQESLRRKVVKYLLKTLLDPLVLRVVVVVIVAVAVVVVVIITVPPYLRQVIVV